MPDDNHDDDEDDHDCEHDDTHVIAHDGFYTNGDHVEPARFYHGEDEPCSPVGGFALDDSYERWRDSDGVLAVRHVEGRSSVGGGSPKYNANYDSIDWGN